MKARVLNTEDLVHDVNYLKSALADQAQVKFAMDISSLTWATEQNEKIIASLLAGLKFFSTQDKSAVQSEKEYHALVFLLAFVAREALEEKDQSSPAYTDYIRLTALLQEDAANAATHYRNLLDWGCYIQANEQYRNFLFDSDGLDVKHIMEQALFNKDNYTQYQELQTQKRKAAYKWYVEGAEPLQQNFDRESSLKSVATWGGILPGVSLLSFYATSTIAAEHWDKKEYGTALLKGAALFLLSAIPLVSGLVGYLIFKPRETAAKKALLTFNGQAETDEIFIRQMMAVEMSEKSGSYQRRTEFPRTFKQERTPPTNKPRVKPKADRDPIENRMSRPKRYSDEYKHTESQPVLEGTEIKSTEVVVDSGKVVYMSIQQRERYKLYEQIRDRRSGGRTHAALTLLGAELEPATLGHSDFTLFNRIQKSKENREDSSDTVLLLHERSHPKPQGGSSSGS